MLLLEKRRNATEVPRTVAAYYEEKLLETLQLLLAKQLHTSLQMMHQPCPLYKQHMLMNILFLTPETSCVLMRTTLFFFYKNQ